MNFIISSEVMFSAVAAEGFNYLWYSEYTPWGSTTKRMPIPSAAASVGLAVIYKAIIHYYWRPRYITELWVLTVWITTLVLCLEASVTLWSQLTIAKFLIDAAHTVAITYVILVVIFLVRVINHAEYPDAVDGTDDATTPPRSTSGRIVTMDLSGDDLLLPPRPPRSRSHSPKR